MSEQNQTNPADIERRKSERRRENAGAPASTGERRVADRRQESPAKKG